MITRTHADEYGARVAWFSDCENYRYLLRIPVAQAFSFPRTTVVFVMLNPSTATEAKNDPTVAKCVRFARRWGFHDLVVVNIFAWRSTDPRVLVGVPNPIGDDNDTIIAAQARAANMVVCAWGRHGKLLARGARVRRQLSAICKLHYLRLTDQPWHPLYLPDATQPTEWAL